MKTNEPKFTSRILEDSRRKSMLVLSRKIGESIVLDGNIKVTVVKIVGNRVRLGIEAPPEVAIKRTEIANVPKPVPSSDQADVPVSFTLAAV
jgi:carbon storage regulator